MGKVKGIGWVGQFQPKNRLSTTETFASLREHSEPGAPSNGRRLPVAVLAGPQAPIRCRAEARASLTVTAVPAFCRPVAGMFW